MFKQAEAVINESENFKLRFINFLNGVITRRGIV
jgi:hypothetical protein